jgi:predicted ribosome quality control (RQC) complex YloA/Tae2 family protein
MRIPFDSFVLQSVVAELGEYVPAKIQDIRQPEEDGIVLSLYSGRREAMLLLCCHPQFARAHLTTKRPANRPTPLAFVSALRSRLDGAGLLEVRQIQGDRVLELTIEGAGGVHRLVAELMGKHANLILVDPGGRVVSAAKWVGPTKSSRPITPGAAYVLPPVMLGGEDLKPSPFYRRLTEALGRKPVADRPVVSHGHGAYPTSVSPLGLPELPRASISVALENYFDLAIPQQEADALRATMLGQLHRVVLARETALGDLRAAEAAGGRAPEWQRLGELVLAYGPSAPAGTRRLQAWDYDGAEIGIDLDPERDFKDNAAAYFDRAKRAKGRLGFVRDQIGRLSEDLANLQALRARVAAETSPLKLQDLREEARRLRYLNAPVLPQRKEDRPYEGHRIRELSAPGGWTLLYGENAEANDYLTLRVAKPNDLWLHVRGGTSAHVVLVTRNQPERVQREALEYAAKVAVLNSPSKHAGFVPVDYTLKKYVRKPRGAAKGTALYTHEKTLHVDS